MVNQNANKRATNLLLLRPRDLPFAYTTLLILTIVTLCTATWLWLSNDGLVSTYLSVSQQQSIKFQVDINRATAPEIANLPQVGPSLAEAIVTYRQAHGPYASVDELTNVSGIGEKKLAAFTRFLLPLPQEFLPAVNSQSSSPEPLTKPMWALKPLKGGSVFECPKTEEAVSSPNSGPRSVHWTP